MTLHPAAWLAWLTAAAVFAFAVTNPFYLLLALGAVLVVHASFPPRRSPVQRAVRTFLVAGLVLLFVRVVFVALLTNPGQTVLFQVLEVPNTGTSLYWRLEDEAENELFNTCLDCGDFDPITFDRDGTYTIIVGSEDSPGLGTYEFQLIEQ